MLRSWVKWAEKNEWLLVTLAGVVLLRIPSLFEPYWYGDEGIYVTVGQALRRGLALYSQIHDNKPPFLYLLAALGGNLFWFKFILLVWSLLTVALFAKLAEKVFGKNKHKIITATVFFGLITTIPLLEGNIANAELFFLMPLMASVLLLWEKDGGLKRVFYSGCLIGLAALFKVPAILEAGIWPLVWLTHQEKGWFKKSAILALGVLLPIVLSGAYFWSKGNLGDYLTAAWAQNLPYLSTWKTAGEAGGIFSLKGRVAVLCILIALVLGLHKRLGRNNSILGIWFLWSLFAALLSGRPYPHYLIQTMPAFSLLIGTFVWGNKKDKWLPIGAMVALVIIIKLWHFYAYNPVNYYNNFISWVGGKKDTQSYRGYFDPMVNSLYEASQVIQAETDPNENIYIWGDMPSLYALSNRLPVGKYTARYHVQSFGDQGNTIKLLSQEMPKIIVTDNQDAQLPGLPGLLKSNYFLEKSIGEIKIFRKFGI